jgi:protein-S-isoprenylcysteine O-methyltransferase Ste14
MVLLDSFARFALQGIGTPAPIFPTRHLVLNGLYRHVRNPMYLAIVSAIVGQGLLLGNLILFGYAALIWLVSHWFVLIYEEPTLRKTFGAEYEAFRTKVPRWLPRFCPWHDQTKNSALAGFLHDIVAHFRAGQIVQRQTAHFASPRIGFRH